MIEVKELSKPNSDYERYYPDVGKSWDLPRLYQDLSTEKGTSLTPFEKACLRGLLQGDDPKAIAETVKWKANSLRVDLSTKIYVYLSDLLNQERVRWEKIAIWLEEKGYKLKNVPVASKLLTISRIPEIQAQTIISSIESKFVGSLLSTSPREEIGLSEEELEKREKQGDEEVQQGNYLEAIKIYASILEENPVTFCGNFVKIAECFEQLQAFKDSVEICYFSLNFIRNAEGRSNIYTFIGSAFHELCRQTRQTDDLDQCLFFYRESLVDRPSNLPSAWNIFDVLVMFHSLNEQNEITYLNKEIIAFCEFKNRVDKAASKLILYNIREDAAKLVKKITNDNLKNEVKEFFNL